MKSAICVIVKNEHKYIEEWIDYHQGLGFDDIYVFEDEDSKSHKEILSNKNNVYLDGYDYNPKLPIILGEARASRQYHLFNWFLDEYKSKYDWIAFIDIDEFIVFEEGWDLNRFCEEYKDYPGVHLAWKMFGANGRIRKPKGKVFESYDATYNTIFTHSRFRVKSIVNTKLAKLMTTNHHVYGGMDVDGIRSIDSVKYKVAWINHYFTKSWEEWCDKILNRGDINPGNRALFDFFLYNPDMFFQKDELFEFAKKNYKVNYPVTVNRHDPDNLKYKFPTGNISILNFLNGTT